jgi:hypothetical protein
VKQSALWSRRSLALLGLLALCWLAAGLACDFSAGWHKAGEAALAWAALALSLVIQRGQQRQVRWMEDRLADLEERLCGRRPEKPEE